VFLTGRALGHADAYSVGGIDAPISRMLFGLVDQEASAQEFRTMERPQCRYGG
jgi:hypothetical protein